MFRIIPNPTFVANVPLTRTGDDAAVLVAFTFRHKSKTAYNDWVRRLQAGDLAIADALHEVIESWDGVEDAAGKPLPYSREALATMIEAFVPVEAEIMRAYSRALTESRVKN